MDQENLNVICDGFLTLMLIKHLPVKTRNPKLHCNVINRQRHKDKRHKTIRHKKTVSKNLIILVYNIY